MGALATYNTRRRLYFPSIHFHLLFFFFMFSFRFSLFLFLSFCHVVFGRMRGLLDRRDSVQPVRIPLNVNDVRQYSLNVAMSSGANVQNLPFSISTATGYTMVAGNTCDSCGVQSYDPASSSSVQQTSDAGQVSLWSSPTSGNLVREDCHLTRANGSSWAYANQPIIVANQSQTIVPSYGYSGVVGLGTNGRDGKFNETLAGNWLSQHPESSNFTYGLALNGPHTTAPPNDGGEMHLLAPDPSAYHGDITWMPMSAFSSNASDADFYIDMDSWVFQSSGGGQLRQSQVHAIVDPFLAPLRFPSAQARAIFSTVAGAQSHANPNTTATNVWDVPCDAKMTLTFTFNGFAVSLDESVLVRQATDHCISTIEEWIDPSVSEYALGSTFISAVYMIFSVSGPSQGSVGLVPRARLESSSGISAGAIAGITIGVLALVILLIVGGVLLFRWHRAKVAKAAEGAPDFSTGPAATPYVYSIEPHETTTLMPMTPTTAGISLSPYRPISTQYYRDAPELSTHATTEYSESSFAPESPPPYAGGSANRINNSLPMNVVAVGPPPTRDRKGRGMSVS